MGKIAFVFPGQGSQHVGMGRELFNNFASVRDIFQTVDERLGYKLSTLCFEGPEEELTLTANTQPAILTTSVAAWSLLDAEGIKPDVVAGHSLGEYSAIVAAGGLHYADAAYAVNRRGSLMQEAVPVGEGAMAALLGLNLETVAEICDAAANGSVLSMANINSAGQIVVAGHAAAVNRAIDLATENGAKRAIRLQVSAPFHCSLMEPAREGMKPVLDSITFNDLSVPLVNNADAAQVQGAAEVKEGLLKQIVAPVRWLDDMHAMLEMGVDTVVELGAGKVLSGLFKRADRSLTIYNVEDSDSLASTIASLKGRKDG